MHHWLKWMKRAMQGRGYTMTKDADLQKKKRFAERLRGVCQHLRDDEIQEAIRLKYLKTDTIAEVIAQMFIDDSIWFNDTAAGAQECLRRSDLFCKYHGLTINRDKSEYLAMNAEGHQVRWLPRIQYNSKESKDTHRAQMREKYGIRRGDAAHAAWAGKHQPLGATMQKKGNTTGAVKRRTRGTESDGRIIKYLGVHHEAQAGWHHQKQLLQEKHKQLMTDMKYKNISLEEAVLAINWKVVSTLAYPIQTADVGRECLRKWDTANRAAVSKAGRIQHQGGISPHLYHIPREEGGIGLQSIEDRSDKARIMNTWQARNDIRRTGEEDKPTTQALVEEAVRMHEHVKGSQAFAIAESMSRLGMTFKKTTQRNQITTAKHADLQHAQSHQ
jgi:hypothetical protein